MLAIRCYLSYAAQLTNILLSFSVVGDSVSKKFLFKSQMEDFFARIGGGSEINKRLMQFTAPSG